MLNRWYAKSRSDPAGRKGRSGIAGGTTLLPWGVGRGWAALAFTLLLAWSQAAPARGALLTYNGSRGGIVLGVTDYGGGAQITPKWIPNNFTGLNDILASPGGTFQLANPVIANNLYDTGVQNFNTLSLGAAGGANGNGPFGAGGGTIFGPLATFGLTDATAGGGGSASYGIESWTSDYTLNQDYNGTFGSYLSIGGFLPDVGSAAVAAMQTEVRLTDLNGNVQNFVFDPLILAMGNAGGGAFTFVAFGGAGAAYVYNPITTGYSMLAVDSYLANLTAGTDILVTSTITFYADPASIQTIAPDDSLLSQIPGGLPGLVLGGTTVPEPGSIVMASIAALAVTVVGGFRRATKRAA